MVAGKCCCGSSPVQDLEILLKVNLNFQLTAKNSNVWAQTTVVRLIWNFPSAKGVTYFYCCKRGLRLSNWSRRDDEHPLQIKRYVKKEVCADNVKVQMTKFYISVSSLQL